MKICRDYLIAIGLVNWVKEKLGINRLYSGTSEQWKSYDQWLQDNHPYVYKFEQAMDKVQDVVCYIPDKFKTFRFFLKNIFVHKTHYLQTGLPIGTYFEIETRMLHGLFHTLQLFVEGELEEFGKFVLDKDVSGLAYLRWMIEAKDTPDNLKAKYLEIERLYTWWKVRVDYEWETLEDRDRQTKEDTEMMIRLINVRDYLWT